MWIFFKKKKKKKKMATFLYPSFDKNEEDKVNAAMDVPSEHVLVRSNESSTGTVPAIAGQGFPADRNGKYIYVTRIDERGNGDFLVEVGFTSTATIDSSIEHAWPGVNSMNGVSLSMEDS